MRQIEVCILCACLFLGIFAYVQHSEYKELELRFADAQAELLEKQGRIERLKTIPNINGLNQSHLRELIDHTLSYLGERGNDWRRLILLTICTESNMGSLLHQIRGPAKGIVQIEPSTEKEVLFWLKTKKPDLYERIRQLRVPARMALHEAEYNNAYAVAVCYGVYVMRNVNPHKKTARQLAQLYKRHYNTVRGKATVPGVLAKL